MNEYNEELYKEKEIICLICQEILYVPIKIKIMNCECDYTICLTCFRSSLKLNNKRQTFNNIFDKCLICKETYKIDRNTICKNYIPCSNLYNIDIDFARYLDIKHGNIKCRYPNCNWEGTRINFITNHSKNCNNLIISCTCGQSYKQKHKNSHTKICPNHILKCMGCGINLPRKRISDHMINCQNLKIKCNICNKLIKRKDTKYHPCIIEELLKTYTCIQQEYNNLLIKLNNISSILKNRVNNEFESFNLSLTVNNPITTNISNIILENFSEYDSINTLIS